MNVRKLRGRAIPRDRRSRFGGSQKDRSPYDLFESFPVRPSRVDRSMTDPIEGSCSLIHSRSLSFTPRRGVDVLSHVLYEHCFTTLGIVASGSTPDDVSFPKGLSLPFNRKSLQVRIPFLHRGSAIPASALGEGAGVCLTGTRCI